MYVYTYTTRTIAVCTIIILSNTVVYFKNCRVEVLNHFFIKMFMSECYEYHSIHRSINHVSCGYLLVCIFIIRIIIIFNLNKRIKINFFIRVIHHE